MPESQDERDEKWVRRLNELAREMDEIGQSVHHAALLESTSDLRAKYRKIAQEGPK